MITVGSVLCVLVFVALWDGFGLLVDHLVDGPNAVPTPTWAVLNAFPGPAIVGLTYIALGFGVAFAAGFEARPTWLVWVVTFGAWMYGAVAVSFLLSWFWTWPEIVVTSATKPILLSVLYVLVRRSLLPPRPERTARS